MKCILSALAVRAVVSGALILLPAITFCQLKSRDCAAIHRGTFYYYPKNSADRFVERMDGQYEHEKNHVEMEVVDEKTGKEGFAGVKLR